MLWGRWLVLLLCWGASSGEQQPGGRDAGGPEVRVDSRKQQRSPPPVEPLDFGYVPSAVYDTHAYFEPGPVGILFHVVHAFLYVIQPNPFPKGECPAPPSLTPPIPSHPPPQDPLSLSSLSPGDADTDTLILGARPS